MTEAYVLTLGRNAIMLALTLAGPILLISLIVGSFVSLVQAATQINESTLIFHPQADWRDSRALGYGLMDASAGCDVYVDSVYEPA